MSTRLELWQDREIKFDVDKYQIKERPGEKLLAYFDPVEDTKGSFRSYSHIPVGWRLSWSDTQSRIFLK